MLALNDNQGHRPVCDELTRVHMSSLVPSKTTIPGPAQMRSAVVGAAGPSLRNLPDFKEYK